MIHIRYIIIFNSAIRIESVWIENKREFRIEIKESIENIRRELRFKRETLRKWVYQKTIDG